MAFIEKRRGWRGRGGEDNERKRELSTATGSLALNRGEVVLGYYNNVGVGKGHEVPSPLRLFASASPEGRFARSEYSPLGFVPKSFPTDPAKFSRFGFYGSKSLVGSVSKSPETPFYLRKLDFFNLKKFPLSILGPGVGWGVVGDTWECGHSVEV